MLVMLRRLALAVGCIFLLATGSWGQTSAIEGTVTGKDGKPLKDALIKIERIDIRGHYQVKTNKKGHYFHAGLPLGRYNVSCEIDGKVADTLRGLRTQMGENAKADFDLQALAAKQKAFQQAAESGTLTAEQTRGMTAEQRKAIQKQMEQRTQAMKKNKALNDAFNAGMTAKQAKQWDVAIQSFEKAAEADPKQHVVWANLAESYVQMAATKAGPEREAALNKGLESYQKVIEMKPDDAAYHNNYALALVKAGKLDEAQAELEQAAQINPAGAGQYYFNLGAVLVNTGKMEAAGAAFKQAIDADPNYANAHFQYGMYLLSKAKIGDNGSIIPVEGTKETLQKYLELAADGPYAASAQGAIQSLSGSVETEYNDPNAKRRKKK